MGHSVHKARQEAVHPRGLAFSYIQDAFYLPVASITYRIAFTGQERRHGGGHALQQWRAGHQVSNHNEHRGVL